MVVGAANRNGLAVYGTTTSPGFVNYGFAGDEPGSNYGPCVDVWAPGKTIYSTWAGTVPFDHSNAATHQHSSTTYSDYIDLSGTSMAAPHIAGMAAYLIETQSLTSPAAVETAIRSYFYNIGGFDHGGNMVWMTQIP